MVEKSIDILLIDNLERQINHYILEGLQSLGYAVRWVKDTEEAKIYLRQNPKIVLIGLESGPKGSYPFSEIKKWARNPYIHLLSDDNAANLEWLVRDKVVNSYSERNESIITLIKKQLKQKP